VSAAGTDSTGHPSHASLLRMVNQIAANFEHRPIDQAAPAVAQHLREYWTPEMRQSLQGQVQSDRLHRVAVAAVGLLDTACSRCPDATSQTCPGGPAHER
jgi:formate dehydrogenase subunit delta